MIQGLYAVHPLAAHRSVGGEVYVVTDDRAFHRLAVATAVDLFQTIVQQGGARREELVSLLVARYQVDPPRAGVDVDAFLQTMLDRHLLVRKAA